VFWAFWYVFFYWFIPLIHSNYIFRLSELLYNNYRFLDLSLSQILDIYKLLTLTYPRYMDSGSRDAVKAVGFELVRRDELQGTEAGEQNEVKFGVAEQILGWLSHEVGRLAKNGNSK